MNRGNLARGLLGPSAVLVLLASMVYFEEGVRGFRVVVNVECMLLVAVGTFLLVWVSYPAAEALRALWAGLCGVDPSDERFRGAREILLRAADSAMAMGAVVSVMGLILMLAGIEDISAVPRRVALMLDGLLYGLLLSEALFAPLAWRVRQDSGASQQKEPARSSRRFLGLFALALILFGIMTVLSALDPGSSMSQGPIGYGTPLILPESQAGARARRYLMTPAPPASGNRGPRPGGRAGAATDWLMGTLERIRRQSPRAVSVTREDCRPFSAFRPIATSPRTDTCLPFWKALLSPKERLREQDC